MNSSFNYSKGTRPLLISMPHNSADIPPELKNRLTREGKKSLDTDWFIDELYDFAPELGTHIIKPVWSRLYIDLNRDPQGKDLYPGSNSTELCPTTDFSGKPIYLAGMEPNPTEINQRLNHVWKPYHQCIKNTLSAMVAEHGYAILFDAHSIRSRVPRFFEGQLPDFNFGSNDGKSCAAAMLTTLEMLEYPHWTRISNGRFKGGYITRNYGKPGNKIHAIQLELSQASYMDEDSLRWNPAKATGLKQQLKQIIQALLKWHQC